MATTSLTRRLEALAGDGTRADDRGGGKAGRWWWASRARTVIAAGRPGGKGRAACGENVELAITAAGLAGRRRWAGRARTSNSVIQAEQDLARIER